MDTCKFYLGDLNNKLWLHPDDRGWLEEEKKLKGKHKFDLLAMSSLDHGMIGAVFFERHHTGRDTGYF